MIRADISEQFPITVTLVDETTASLSTGKTVLYEVRKQPGDIIPSPAVSGVLIESSVEPGVYKTTASLNEAGNYIIYATCSGFLANTEDIIINENNLASLVKQNRHYNTSVEDVPRSNSVPTASQTVRNVGLGKTDYILTRIKLDDSADWNASTTISGIVYAHYHSTDDTVPYKMSGDGV